MPMANHLERNSAAPERSGWSQSTSGAAQAPRCFSKKPRFVASAHASARSIPICTVIPVQPGGGPPPLFGLSVPVPSGLRPPRAPQPRASNKLRAVRFPFSRKTTHGVKGSRKLSDECPGVCDDRPVLFVDVDGVISLFGFDPSDGLPGSFVSVDGILHCIGSEAGQRLAR